MEGDLRSSEQLPLPGISFDTAPTNEIEVEGLTAEKVEALKRRRPKSLGLKCTRTNCPKDLHCFDPKGRDFKGPFAPCTTCGVDLTNWETMHTRELATVTDKFALLKHEWIRHFFFHVPITPRIEHYAKVHGVQGLAQVALDQLRRNKMIRYSGSTWHDRQQTPMLGGTIVHWARHAVACCCRQCLAYWHNIPLNSELTDSELAYFQQLIVLYIRERLPDLNDLPEKKMPMRGHDHALARRVS